MSVWNWDHGIIVIIACVGGPYLCQAKYCGESIIDDDDDDDDDYDDCDGVYDDCDDDYDADDADSNNDEDNNDWFSVMWWRGGSLLLGAEMGLNCVGYKFGEKSTNNKGKVKWTKL